MLPPTWNHKRTATNQITWTAAKATLPFSSQPTKAITTPIWSQLPLLASGNQVISPPLSFQMNPESPFHRVIANIHVPAVQIMNGGSHILPKRYFQACGQYK